MHIRIVKSLRIVAEIKLPLFFCNLSQNSPYNPFLTWHLLISPRVFFTKRQSTVLEENKNENLKSYRDTWQKIEINQLEIENSFGLGLAFLEKSLLFWQPCSAASRGAESNLTLPSGPPSKVVFSESFYLCRQGTDIAHRLLSQGVEADPQQN